MPAWSRVKRQRANSPPKAHDGPDRERVTLTGLMWKITTRVDLKALGIEVLNARMSRAGGGVTLIMKTEEETDILADKMKAAVGADATVSRPAASNSVLFFDIPDWTEKKTLKLLSKRRGATSLR